MAWYSDEEYEFKRDSRDKKCTAASAHKQRTHCGKGGRVRFPSDYKTRKELNAMNGECKTYKINQYATQEEYDTYPDYAKAEYDRMIEKLIQTRITWDDFKSWGNRAQRLYIERLREKYQAPSIAIAGMFGVSNAYFGLWLREHDMGIGKNNGNARRKWDKDGFEHWAYPTKFIETVEQITEEQKAEEQKAEEESVEIVCEAPEAPVSDVCDPVEAVVEGNTEVCEAPEAAEAVDILEVVNEAIDELKRVAAESDEYVEPMETVIPESGMLAFNCNASSALETLRVLLRNAHVKLKVEWEAV